MKKYILLSSEIGKKYLEFICKILLFLLDLSEKFNKLFLKERE